MLHREIESPQVHQNWIDEWVKNGGDAVLAGIMDSPEGIAAMQAERTALGI